MGVARQSRTLHCCAIPTRRPFQRMPVSLAPPPGAYARLPDAAQPAALPADAAAQIKAFFFGQVAGNQPISLCR